MTRFDVILWDIDGTLLHAGGIGRESTRLAMEAVFGTAAGLDGHHFGGKTDWQTLALLLEPHGYTPDAVGAHMADYVTAIEDAIHSILPDYTVRPLPYALELLTDLTRCHDLLHGIVTGNVHTTAPVKLRAAGFDPAWFPFGAYGDESVDRRDLPPRAIARAIELTGRDIAPERVLVVGDTPQDIDCAHAAGAVACAVETGFASREALAAANPDYLIPDLTHFRRILV